MSLENKLQETIHKLEVGGWVPWIKLALISAIVALLYSAVIFDIHRWYSFSGLSHSKGMDQAQIARNIARGNGFSTGFIRPSALAQFDANVGGYPPSTKFPDTFHAPLNPVFNAGVIRVFDSINAFLKKTPALQSLAYEPVMNKKIIVYAYDRIIAAMSLLFFVGSLPLIYLTLRSLFDKTLATMASLLIIGCYKFWDFAATGLPQLMMVFFFSAAFYFLVRAAQNKTAEKPVLRWVVGVAVCFGFLALANPITLWVFAGAVVYMGIAFTPRPLVITILLGVVALMYTPWLMRNVRACGNPFGVAHYSLLTQVAGTEGEILRSQEVEHKVPIGDFRPKVQKSLSSQLSDIYGLLGSVITAPIFFLALLHAFKRPEAASLRWGILSMWAGGALGMAITGFNDREQYQSNDLYLLFIPVMTAYGLALLLNLWTRLDIQVKLIRYGFIGTVFAVSILPLLTRLLDQRSGIQWPPYVPMGIARLAEWTNRDELIMSDMPWAVSWYAERSSLWMPLTVQEFVEMNDYGKKLSGKVVMMYLTPVTGDQPFLSGIVHGSYSDWAPFIARQAKPETLKDFPLKAMAGLEIGGDCIVFADRERWRDSGD